MGRRQYFRVRTGSNPVEGRAARYLTSCCGVNLAFAGLGLRPGPVWTPRIPSTMPPQEVKEFGKNTAFERHAQPAELAPLFVFLASQHATYVTAEIYGATGGRTPY